MNSRLDTTQTSRDRPAPGLVIHQPIRGFRYAMDPFLLCAWSLEAGAPRDVVDLGTGSGIMALLLARLGVRCVGYDLRPEWITLARRSASDSGLEVRFEHADIRSLPPGDADLAVLNPPYLRAGQGRPSPDPWKAAARTELNGTLAELMTAAATQARRVCLVFGADRSDDAIEALGIAGLHLCRRCDVDASLVLLEGRPRARELEWERVSMRQGDGWSPRVRGWYERLGARLN